MRVLFLTARDAVEERIAGIAAGGDDYVTKPFSLDEVIARLHGLLRRAEPGRDRAGTREGTLVVGGLVLDDRSHEVTRDGGPIELSPTEYALLRYLMQHPRQVLSKAEILNAVWSYDFGGQAHVVELYISYLRKKVDHGCPPVIHTVRGAGYVLRGRAMRRPVPRTLRSRLIAGMLTLLVLTCAGGGPDHHRQAAPLPDRPPRPAAHRHRRPLRRQPGAPRQRGRRTAPTGVHRPDESSDTRAQAPGTFGARLRNGVVTNAGVVDGDADDAAVEAGDRPPAPTTRST